MTYEEFEQIDGELTARWKDDTNSPDFQLVLNEWEASCKWPIRTKATAQVWDRGRYRAALIDTWDTLGKLFHGLHPVIWPDSRTDENKTRFFWYHRRIDIKTIDDKKRGFEIDREQLSQAATSYVSSPDAQSNRMDWLLLDTLVFADIEKALESYKENMTAMGARVAESIAEGNVFKYAFWRVLFFALGIFVSFVAMPLGAYYLLQIGHENAALGVFGIWVLFTLWWLVTLPIRWKAKGKFWKAFKKLSDVYTLLGESTISPRKLKDAIDAATALGCHFDGAVFTIVDRMIARDPTAFIPSKQG